MPARPAFTLIEMLLVIVLMAVLSTSTIFAFDDLQDKTSLQSVQNMIVSELQQGRNIASNALLSADANIAYYRVDVRPNFVSIYKGTLSADGTSITVSKLESIPFTEDFTIISPTGVGANTPWSVWYLTPNASVCPSYTASTSSCNTSVTSKSIVINSLKGRYQSTITVSSPGGFPEVVGPTHL